MRKLFEAIFTGKQKLQQEWNCLEVWTSDVRFTSSGYTHPWGCSGTEIGSTASGIGTGDTNTDEIIAGCVATNNAATVAREARGGETDWYLPSSDELAEMWTQRDIIPAFGDGTRVYWSSTEEDSTRAKVLDILGQIVFGNKVDLYYVRPIRKCFGAYEVGDIGPSGGIIFYVQPAVPTHKISIYDNDLVEDGSSQDVIVEAPGYTVNWNAGISDVVTGQIIESSAEFTIRNIDGVLDDFIDNLNTNPEGRFVVELQKKTVLTEEWQSNWKGIMMPDFSSRTDIPNEPISFQATDGMALLDAVELTAEDSELMLVTVIKGLRQIPTVGLFDNLSELRFLWCKTDWYSEDLISGTEPLYQLGMFGKSLWVKKEVSEGYSGELKTEIVGLTYKEVLRHICERFNCILVMQQGAWYLFQRDLLLEDTIEFQTFRAYPTSGDNYTTSPNSYTVATYKGIDQSERYRSSGEFFNLPGLKSVKVIYGGGNLADGSDSLIPSGFILGQTYTTMPLEAATDNKLHLRISFQERYLIDWVGATPPDEYFAASIQYKIIIRAGAYYLNVFTGAWTLDSSVADFIYLSQTRLHHNTAAAVVANNIPDFIDQISFYKDLITDDIPVDAEVTFRMERYGVLVHSGGSYFTVDINDDFNFTPDLENHFLLFIVNDESPQAYVEFTAENPTSGFQLEHDMGESLFGTARVIMNRVIGANNGGGELWEVGYGTTPDLFFNELLVREILKKQSKALMCFSGTVLERNEDYMYLFQAIQFDVDSTTYRFVFNNVTYDAMRETWTGDWFEIKDSGEVIEPSVDDEAINLDNIPAIPRPNGQIYDQAFEEIYQPDTEDIDTTQQGTSDGGVITNRTELVEQTTAPTTPDTGKVVLWADSEGNLVSKNSSGDSFPISISPYIKTYAQMVSAIAASELIPYAFYKITDYATKYNQPVTDIITTATGEAIIVQALTSSTIRKIAFSPSYPEDTIYYDIDNNRTELDDADRTGLIYRRIDTKNNKDIGFDWRSVKFRRYACNQTLWAAGTYAQGDIRRVVGDGVYVSLEDSNSDNPTGVTEKWIKCLDLSLTNYWGYDSGVLDGISFDATDYVDVFMMSDVNDVTNGSGMDSEGRGFTNILFQNTNFGNASRWNLSQLNQYGNNVIYYDSTQTDDISSFYNNIRLINGCNFDEGDEIVHSNTFAWCNNVDIRGLFVKNVISINIFDFHKPKVHYSMEANYFQELAQLVVDGQGSITTNKVAAFNNSEVRGSLTGTVSNSISKVVIDWNYNVGSLYLYSISNKGFSILKLTSISADYTIQIDDDTIEVTANSPTITTSSVIISGIDKTITNLGTGIAVVTGNVLGGDFSLYQYESITIRSNGTNWIVR